MDDSVQDLELDFDSEVYVNDSDTENAPNERSERSSTFKVDHSFTILSFETAWTRRQNEIDRICSILGNILSTLRFGPTYNFADAPGNFELVEAIVTHNRWDCEVAAQEFISDPEKCLTGVGFPPDKFIRKPPEPPDMAFLNESVNFTDDSESRATFTCPILCVEYPVSEMTVMPCGHRASNEAWLGYLSEKIGEGRVVAVKCMMCNDPIPYDNIAKLLPPKLLEKWRERLVTSMAVNCAKLRFCAGTCRNIIEVKEITHLQVGQVNYTFPIDVHCGGAEACGATYCFKCGSEPHRPIPCELMAAWDIKNRGEAENVTWIFVNTKSCPKCTEAIEKNHGCMHMTCRCGFEFCWICCGNWKSHNQDSFRCNVFITKSQEEQDLQKRAAACLAKYAHFFERYRAHKQGQEFAEKKLVQYGMKTGNAAPSTSDGAVEDLSAALEIKKAKMNVLFVDLMKKAVEQIVLGRRMLKLSYAFGYFANWTFAAAGKDLFEHQQGELECTLDLLQDLTEKLDVNVQHVSSAADRRFENYNRQLSNLTRVVRDFFVKMTDVFESEVVEKALPAEVTLEDRASVDVPVK